MCKMCDALDASRAHNLKVELERFITRNSDPIMNMTITRADINMLAKVEAMFEILLRERYVTH